MLTFVEEFLLKIGELIEALKQPVTMDKFYHYCYGDLSNYKDKKKKQKIYSTFYSLKKNNYLIKKGKGNKSFYILTPKALIKILKIKNKIRKRKKWDGKYRIVIFDIPEKFKKIRDLFRRSLYQLNFKELQESILISEDNLFDEVERLANYLGIREYIKLILADEIIE